MSETTLVMCILAGFPFVFLIIWNLVMLITSFVGGWNKLASDFATECPDNLDWIGWQMARLGFVDYKNTVWIAVNQKGLYLKTGPSILFRFMHPPLLIPWKDVKEVQEKSFFGFSYAGMKVNGVSIMLPMKTLEPIEEQIAQFHQ